MEVGYEMEDDLYFADLSKQISLLIMDDDDDDQLPVAPWQYSSSLQGLSRSTANQSVPPPCMYEEHRRRSETSKGTGVFIPKLSQPPRRRNRQQGGRRFISSSRSHKQHHDNNGMMMNHTIYRSSSGAATPQTYFTQKSFQPQEILKPTSCPLKNQIK